MKLYQLIARSCIACVILNSCSGNTSDDHLNNHPAADTVAIPDTIKNFPISIPDSLNAGDTLALNY